VGKSVALTEHKAGQGGSSVQVWPPPLFPCFCRAGNQVSYRNRSCEMFVQLQNGISLCSWEPFTFCYSMQAKI